jgi:hypothetical protein
MHVQYRSSFHGVRMLSRHPRIADYKSCQCHSHHLPDAHDFDLPVAKVDQVSFGVDGL